MNQPSFTSTDSFRQRAQKSELRRIAIWIGVLIALLVIFTAQRFTGGAAASNNRLFILTFFIYGTGLIYQVAMYLRIKRAIREQQLLPDSLWTLSFIIDLFIPAAGLTTMQWFSPLGPVASLSVPIVLLMPTVILLSVLRLRPRLTLLAGGVACVFHWALTARAIAVAQPPSSQIPTLLTYGVGMLLIGIAGGVVAREMRNHVVQVTEESAAREAAQRERDRLTRDLELARDIQRSLLPKAPLALPGFSIAGWNQAADETGGDYYDWMTLPDGRAIVVIADATGHGIGPALLIAVCRAYLRASTKTNMPLEAILTQVNALLVEDLPAGKFVTAAVLVLDPATSTGELYSAGHAPLHFYNARENTVTSWDADEMPLGISSDFGGMRSRTIQFEPGDMLLLLTDGFFEWPNAEGELFGGDRVESCILKHARETPADVISHLHNEVLAFAQKSPQRDDLTAVVLQRSSH